VAAGVVCHGVTAAVAAALPADRAARPAPPPE
jgi:hypothetical protein